MTREYSRPHMLAGLGTVGAGLGASVVEIRAAPCEGSNPFDSPGGGNDDGNGNNGHGGGNA